VYRIKLSRGCQSHPVQENRGIQLWWDKEVGARKHIDFALEEFSELEVMAALAIAANSLQFDVLIGNM